MEPMTMEWYTPDMDERVIAASIELREASEELTRASERYHAAIVARIGILAVIRGYHEA